jgi:hypothetical protein
VLDCQLQEGSLDLVAVDESGDLVAGRREVEVFDMDVQRLPARPPDLVAARIDEEAMEPGIEPVGVPKGAQVAPCSDEGVLDGVLRCIPIAEYPPRDRVQAVVGGGRDGVERLVIAPLCTFDEIGRHGPPSARRGNLPHSDGMASRSPRSFIARSIHGDESSAAPPPVSLRLVTDQPVDPRADPTPPRRPRSTGPVQYRGTDLEPARGPGLGCFRFQLAVLAIFIVLAPLSVGWGWPTAVSAGLLFAVILLLLVTGQTMIFLLRLVAADRRGRRRPMASATMTVGELEDAATEDHDAEAEDEGAATADDSTEPESPVRQ